MIKPEIEAFFRKTYFKKGDIRLEDNGYYYHYPINPKMRRTRMFLDDAVLLNFVQLFVDFPNIKWNRGHNSLPTVLYNRRTCISFPYDRDIDVSRFEYIEHADGRKHWSLHVHKNYKTTSIDGTFEEIYVAFKELLEPV